MIIEHLDMNGKFAIMETTDYIQLISEFPDDIIKVRNAIYVSIGAAAKGNLKPEPGFFCPCTHEQPNHVAVVVQDQPTLLRCCETNERVEDTEGQPRLAWYGAVPERGEYIIACAFQLLTFLFFGIATNSTEDTSKTGVCEFALVYS